MARTVDPAWVLSSRVLIVLGSAVLATGCTSPNVTATIEGEPVCLDFELGAARATMKGGLRKPVQVTVLDDGDIVSQRTLLGKRTAESKTPKVLVHDDDETYTIEWAQCENVRAPRPVRKEKRGANQVAAYACGEATAYATRELKVRRGDPSSRVMTFVAPPEPACWMDSVPEGANKDDEDEPDAGASSDAGVPDGAADAAADGAADAAPSATAAAKAPAPRVPDKATKGR